MVQNKAASAIKSSQGDLPPIQSKQAPVQAKQVPIQAKQRPIQRNTGSSKSSGNVNEAQVKANVSNIMGVDVTQAKVNYNSGKPAQLKAEAYAQGNTVEIAPGKEKHLGHELAHIGQQAQGRVQPTIQGNNGIGINNDPKLEKEVDDIGDQAMSMQPTQMKQNNTMKSSVGNTQQGAPVQGKFEYDNGTDLSQQAANKIIEMLKDKSGLEEFKAKFNDDETHDFEPWIYSMELTMNKKVWKDIQYYVFIKDKKDVTLSENESYELDQQQSKRKEKRLKQNRVKEEQDTEFARRVDSGTELSTQQVKNTFTKVLRTDMTGLGRLLQLDERSLRTDSLTMAKANYKNIKLGFESSYPGYQFKKISTIRDTEALEQEITRLINDKKLISNDAMRDIKDHWDQIQKSKNMKQEELDKLLYGARNFQDYVRIRLAQKREKTARVWGGAAKSLILARNRLAEFNVMDRKLNPTFRQGQERRNNMKIAQQGVARQTQQKIHEEGRDVQGRLAYNLMIKSGQDIFNEIAGIDSDNAGDSAGRVVGVAKTMENIDGIFGQAACHDDAQRILKLMSSRRKFKNESRVQSQEIAQEVITKITKQVESCKSKKKIVKLTNYNNHSLLLMVGQDDSTQMYETYAGLNSTKIMQNDIIREHIASESNLGAALQKYVLSIADTDSLTDTKNLLQWEVHEATNNETFEQRMGEHMQETTTSFHITNSIVSMEYSQLRGDSNGDLFDTTKYKDLYIPLAKLNNSATEIFNLHDEGKSSQLQAGQIYRMKHYSKWFRAKYNGVSQSIDIPSWMGECGQFEITEVGTGCDRVERRQEPVLKRSITEVMMWIVGDTSKEARAPFREAIDQTGSEWVIKRGQDRDKKVVIVSDPEWQTANFARKVTYKIV